MSCIIRVAAVALMVPGTVAGDALAGSVAVGYRHVSVAGDRNKYDEDVNLDDGARLLQLAVTINPNGDGPLIPDLVDLDARQLGGDPFENSRLTIRKYGTYTFRASRRRSSWVYDDLIVAQQDASIAGSTGGDFHRRDIERVRDDASLGVNVNDRTTLVLGIARSTRRGDSTTTLSLQRDEFELEKPVDERLRTWFVTGTYRHDRFLLALEERIQDYENRTTLVLPGYTVGANRSNATTLSSFSLHQPHVFRAREHRLRMTGDPLPRVTASLRLLAGKLDLDTNVTERSQGTGFSGAPFTTAVDGDGTVERDTTLLELTFNVAITGDLDATTRLRRTSLDQHGEVVLGGDRAGRASWEVETTVSELGLDWQATDELSLAAGWRAERRDLMAGAEAADDLPRTDDERTTSDAVFARLDWRPTARLSLSARFNDTSLTDPYALASPADVRRHRLRARYRVDEFAVSATHTSTELANELADWSSHARQTTLRFDFANELFSLSLGATFADNRRDYRRLVTGGTRQDLFDVAYAAETSNADVSLRWSPHERLSLGGALRRYDNAGSLKVDRRDRQLFVALGIAPGYVIDLSWRDIDYSEGGLESYAAGIVEAVVRLEF